MKLKLKHGALFLYLWLCPIASSSAASPPDNSKILHLLNRISFGPRLGDIEKVRSHGTENYIQQQLSPETIPEPQNLTSRINRLETLQKTPAELFVEYGVRRSQNGQKPTPEAIRAASIKARIILQEAVKARLLRSAESPRQLQEVMVDFWYNHFNVYSDKGLNKLWVGAYEQEAIRPYALGKFRDLLGATSRHPAMLYYLDNWQNTDPKSIGAKGGFRGLNENYARELMELHTLGVNGGYRQQDVIALARIFTGWGFGLRPSQKDGYSFYFDAKRHDFSDKVFLGKTIKGSGETEGKQALTILAKSPATAKHVSYKLAQYFVADSPPNALVDRLSQRFLETDGDIREVLNTLFRSREFWDKKNYSAKFKTPYQYVISAVRSTNKTVENFQPLYTTLLQLGMAPYGCPTPDGYKNTQDAWLNPDAIARRLSFVTALATNPLYLNSPPADNNQSGWMLPAIATPSNSSLPMGPRNSNQLIDPSQLANILGNDFSANTKSAIASSPANLRTALILGSPEFMRR
ncbi:DUF1800 domain-containing protein [Microcoleus sp. PH2017_30_WIL_O_A]|uniref:DUF1800 domain-containing protein n=1 Tax=Microcoleus sp. PH2017_30_WIL_O_A TaxID=2798840 RepID=UPI001D24E66D|nr:DUF1800 domain-containing protein [Microcoleus sp. PH2017_30_WIL_O_A]MCC3582737.1 DUF1800 domain-containing protein [Microcoleus sp. PH2017_30_WIL_O_A]